MNQKITKNIQTVLDILNDEVNGNVTSALNKMTRDYSMTWLYQDKDGTLFPTVKSPTKDQMKKIYSTRGREYDLKNMAEGDDIVMIEIVESYPDTETNRRFRTPLVIVLEFRDGKIKKGRHYCDPDLSYLYLSKFNVDQAYK